MQIAFRNSINTCLCEQIYRSTDINTFTSRMSFKRLRVHTDPQPQDINLRSICANCLNLADKINEVKENVDNLKLFMSGKLDQIEKNQLNQNKVVMSALAEQKVLTGKLLRQESLAAPIVELFPISTDDDLATVDEKIVQDNRDIYVSTMTKLFQHSAAKNIKNIIDEKMIIRYNVDGTHGKKSLKSFKNFFAALLDAIARLPSSANPEEQLRNAFRIQKKRYFKNSAALNKTL